MGSNPGRGIQPIFSEEYVEREKDSHILICTFPFIATIVFLRHISVKRLSHFNISSSILILTRVVCPTTKMLIHS